MQWLELTVHTTTAAIDLLAAELTVLGYDSFIIDDQADFHKFLEENRQYWGLCRCGIGGADAGPFPDSPLFGGECRGDG